MNQDKFAIETEQIKTVVNVPKLFKYDDKEWNSSYPMAGLRSAVETLQHVFDVHRTSEKTANSRVDISSRTETIGRALLYIAKLEEVARAADAAIYLMDAMYEDQHAQVQKLQEALAALKEK